MTAMLDELLADEDAELPLWGLEAAGDVHADLVLTALDPISHGAGTSGNTQRLRRQDFVTPDGRRASVPFVSGASLRHVLRDALAWHTVRLLRLPAASLPKLAVDLLWSGGAITETGSKVDLARLRRVHQVTAALGLLGYSARSDQAEGTLRHAGMLHLLCAENAWRAPGRLQGHPHAALPERDFRSEDFGTRHDIAMTPAARYIAAASGQEVPSVQMIWDTQVIKPGAVLFSSLLLKAPTGGHVAALATALDLAAPVQPDGRRIILIGGKTAQGYGACELDPDGLAPLGDLAGHRAEYEARLSACAHLVLPLLHDVTGARP